MCWLIPKIGRPAGIAVQAYGTMMLLAIIAAVSVLWWRAPGFGISRNEVLELCFWMCLVGILGARTFYVIEYWPQMQADTLWGTVGNILNFPAGGLVVYGSLFGGVLGATIYLKVKKLPILSTFDLLAPSMVLGLSLGRIGCFLNGCCFGGVCDVPDEKCCVCFPAGSPPYMRQLEEGQLTLDLEDTYYGIRFSSEEEVSGARIAAVLPGSEAEKHGMCAGDVILRVNGRKVHSRDEVRQLEDRKMRHLKQEKGKDTEKVPENDWLTKIGSRSLFAAEEAAYLLVEAPKIDGMVHLYFLRDGKDEICSWQTLSSAGPKSLPVYPTQIFSSAGAFVLFLILMIYSSFRKAVTRPGMKMPGEVLALMLTLYPVMRFLLEIVRVDETSFMGTGLSISQNVSILLLFLVSIFWMWIFWRNRRARSEILDKKI